MSLAIPSHLRALTSRTGGASSSSQARNSGLLGSWSLSERSRQGSDTSIASHIGGNTVQLAAGNDVTLSGSMLTARQGGSISAGNAITLAAAPDTRTENRQRHETSSGFTATGYQRSSTSQSSTLDATTRSSSSQPGMQWIRQLTDDPQLAAKVHWSQMQQAHDVQPGRGRSQPHQQCPRQLDPPRLYRNAHDRKPFGAAIANPAQVQRQARRGVGTGIDAGQ